MKTIHFIFIFLFFNCLIFSEDYRTEQATNGQNGSSKRIILSNAESLKVGQRIYVDKDSIVGYVDSSFILDSVNYFSAQIDANIPLDEYGTVELITIDLLGNTMLVLRKEPNNKLDKNTYEVINSEFHIDSNVVPIDTIIYDPVINSLFKK